MFSECGQSGVARSIRDGGAFVGGDVLSVPLPWNVSATPRSAIIQHIVSKQACRECVALMRRAG